VFLVSSFVAKAIDQALLGVGEWIYISSYIKNCNASGISSPQALILSSHLSSLIGGIDIFFPIHFAF